MIRHLFKLVWNRKQENFLMATEIFFAFLVLCALSTQVIYYWTNWRLPLGFTYENVWVIRYNANRDFTWKPDDAVIYKAMTTELRSFEEVEAVAGTRHLPFDFSNWNQGDSVPGKQLVVERDMVTDDFAKVLGLEIIQGKWYDASDDALSYTPVVINERLAQAYFGDENPIGKRVHPFLLESLNKEPSLRSPREERVIGVIKEYRKTGEVEQPMNFSFQRSAQAESLMTEPPHHFLLRLRTDAGTAALEEKMVKRLEAVAKGFTFKAQPLSNFRDRRLRERLTPLISFAVVGGFLVVMVALGLVGVVWQNVVRRTREIGLRRAVGSTARLIYTQILGELLVITTFAVVAGMLVIVQFPLLGVFKNLTLEVYALGLAVSLVFIYGIACLCALYPSNLATKVEPVEALRYE